MKSIKISIPYEFTDLNNYIKAERSNKYISAKIKKNETDISCLYTKQYKEQLKLFKMPLKLIFTWYLINKRKDLDNISFSKKFIIDGLVKSGCITNDGQKQIIAFEDKIKYSDNVSVEIEIQEV